MKSLSDKIKGVGKSKAPHYMLDPKHVKKFIKDLKNITRDGQCNCEQCLHAIIDDLAGNKLT